MKVNPGLSSKKKCKDKVKWVAAKEATIIAMLLTQKASGNSSESGIKSSMWTLVVHAVAGATTDSTRKDVMQCKTCYHWVCLLSLISLFY